MNSYYVPFNFPDYEPIRKVIEKKYKDEFNPTELGTKLVPWTLENFIGLYEYVEKQFKLTQTPIQRARFFYTPGNTKLDAHIDGHTNFRFGKPTNLYWALNFPIIVPENNHIHQWYEYTGKFKQAWNEKYTSGITPVDRSLLVATESLVLDKPYFVNVGQLHSVINSSSNPRLILSLRFESRTVFQFMESLK